MWTSMVSLSNIWHSTINEFIWYMNSIIQRIHLYYSPFIYKTVTLQERCSAKCFQTNMMYVKKFWHFWRDIFYTWWFFLVKIPNLPHFFWTGNTLEKMSLIKILVTDLKSFPDNIISYRQFWTKWWSLKFASCFEFKFCYTEFASFGQLH
jgi:hypothetical protein